MIRGEATKKSHPKWVAQEWGYTLGYTCRASSHADSTCGSNLLSFPIRTALIVPSRTQAQSVCRVTPMIAMTSVVLRYEFRWRRCSMIDPGCAVVSIYPVNTDGGHHCPGFFEKKSGYRTCSFGIDSEVGYANSVIFWSKLFRFSYYYQRQC